MKTYCYYIPFKMVFSEGKILQASFLERDKNLNYNSDFKGITEDLKQKLGICNIEIMKPYRLKGRNRPEDEISAETEKEFYYKIRFEIKYAGYTIPASKNLIRNTRIDYLSDIYDIINDFYKDSKGFTSVIITGWERTPKHEREKNDKVTNKFEILT